MRRTTIGFAVLLGVGIFLLVAPQVRSQSPDRRTPRGDGAQLDGQGEQRRPERGGRGFRFPSPPLLSIIDKNNDGKLSPEEIGWPPKFGGGGGGFPGPGRGFPGFGGPGGGRPQRPDPDADATRPSGEQRSNDRQ